MLIAGSCVWRIIIIARGHSTLRPDVGLAFVIYLWRGTLHAGMRGKKRERARLLIFRVLIMVCIILWYISNINCASFVIRRKCNSLATRDNPGVVVGKDFVSQSLAESPRRCRICSG